MTMSGRRRVGGSSSTATRKACTTIAKSVGTTMEGVKRCVWAVHSTCSTYLMIPYVDRAFFFLKRPAPSPTSTWLEIYRYSPHKNTTYDLHVEAARTSLLAFDRRFCQKFLIGVSGSPWVFSRYSGNEKRSARISSERSSNSQSRRFTEA